jgi:arginase
MPPTRPIAVLGAPSAIGISPYRHGAPRRLDLAPGVLRERGLVERLGASDRGDVPPPDRYADLERPAGRGRNEEDVAAYSRDLAGAVAELDASRHFVLLLGGDCSVMLGALLGLRPRGRIGVAYVDAHADFATLDESRSGSACSMNLALATGRAASPLSRLGGGEPLVRGEDVVHLGRRDDGYGHEALAHFGIDDLGRDASAAGALARLRAVDGYWVHFDVDVLDPTLMPAVDSPVPGGLDAARAAELLGPVVADPRALGLQVTIYDPGLDPDGRGASSLVGILADALGSSI